MRITLRAIAVALIVVVAGVSIAEAHWFVQKRHRFYGPTGYGYPNARFHRGPEWYGAHGPMAGEGYLPGEVPDTYAPFVPGGPGVSPGPQRSDQIVPDYVPPPPPARGIGPGAILMNIRVPEDAVVEINGHPTKQTGSLRTFVANDLEAGGSYQYEIHAQVERHGQVLREVQMIDATAGTIVPVDFMFGAGPSGPSLPMGQVSTQPTPAKSKSVQNTAGVRGR